MLLWRPTRAEGSSHVPRSVRGIVRRHLSVSSLYFSSNVKADTADRKESAVRVVCAIDIAGDVEVGTFDHRQAIGWVDPAFQSVERVGAKQVAKTKHGALLVMPANCGQFQNSTRFRRQKLRWFWRKTFSAECELAHYTAVTQLRVYCKGSASPLTPKLRASSSNSIVR